MATFIPNPIGLAEIPASPGVVAETAKVTEGIALAAQAIAPVLTGAYRASIHADVGVEGGHAVGRVAADVDYASYIEFGTEDTPTFAPLRRAAEGYRIL